jgi:hypothetical protein
MGQKQTSAHVRVMSALPPKKRTLDNERHGRPLQNVDGSIPFASVGLCQEKTKQNQNLILAKVPRGSVKLKPNFK